MRIFAPTACLLAFTSQSLAAPANPSTLGSLVNSILNVKLVVFGDSFSDNGNAYDLDNKAFPVQPYDNGRFSNGPVWNEALTGRGGLNIKLINKAYGGATTGTSTGFVTDLQGVNYAVPSLLDQVSEYSRGLSPSAGLTSIHVLFAGGNDHNNKLVKNLGNVTVPLVIANIKTSALQLIEKGAKHIVLMNVPPASKCPRLIPTPQIGAIFDSMIDAHNAALVPLVSELKSAGAWTVSLFDTNSLVKDMAENPSKYGFTNVKDACVDLAKGTVCGPQQEYMFWDQLHPTTRTHNIIADKMVAFLKNGGRSM
ncbi:hypothetical protein HK097_000682 [Rhizophlyctis rosea]|uniref:Uncharacterized protein n=1 Tax=Rhizophlyctis rosea TaxID=64517 RepID=A0AAD5S6F7_9FUNG|nr:hypothetical protein HK097_000682 [Rhizophlyctis rosea]